LFVIGQFFIDVDINVLFSCIHLIVVFDSLSHQFLVGVNIIVGEIDEIGWSEETVVFLQLGEHLLEKVEVDVVAVNQPEVERHVENAVEGECVVELVVAVHDAPGVEVLEESEQDDVHVVLEPPARILDQRVGLEEHHRHQDQPRKEFVQH